MPPPTYPLTHSPTQAGNADLALAMCGEMKKGGLELDGVVYTMIVQALGIKGEVRRAALLVASVQRDFAEGKSPTQIVKSTYNMLLKVAVESGSWAIAVGALSEILLRFTPNDATYAALITSPLEEDEAGPGLGLGMEAAAGSGGSATYQPDLGDYDETGDGYDQYGDAGESREGAGAQSCLACRDAAIHSTNHSTNHFTNDFTNRPRLHEPPTNRPPTAHQPPTTSPTAHQPPTNRPPTAHRPPTDRPPTHLPNCLALTTRLLAGPHSISRAFTRFTRPTTTVPLFQTPT